MNWPLMSVEEQSSFGVEAIHPYVEKEGVTIMKLNPDLTRNPQIVGQMWGSLALIFVQTEMYPLKGKLSEVQRLEYLGWAEKHHAIALFASVGLACTAYPDKSPVINDTDMCLPIRRAGFAVAYEGLVLMTTSKNIKFLTAKEKAEGIASIDPSKRLHHNFAHVALPILALMNPSKFFHDVSGRKSEEYLKLIWQGLAGKMGVLQSPKGLTVIKKVVYAETEAFIIQLPKPNEVADAFFVATVFRVNKKALKKEVLSVRYFTLELGLNVFSHSDEYYFCEWIRNVGISQQHKNYGQIADSNVDTFLSAIYEVI